MESELHSLQNKGLYTNKIGSSVIHTRTLKFFGSNDNEPLAVAETLLSGVALDMEEVCVWIGGKCDLLSPLHVDERFGMEFL